MSRAAAVEEEEEEDDDDDELPEAAILPLRIPPTLRPGAAQNPEVS